MPGGPGGKKFKVRRPQNEYNTDPGCLQPAFRESLFFAFEGRNPCTCTELSIAWQVSHKRVFVLLMPEKPQLDLGVLQGDPFTGEQVLR